MATHRLEPHRSALLVIDVQQKLLPFIHEGEHILQEIMRLVRGCALFEVPVLASEQYPAGIGHTDALLAACLREAGAATLEKMTFSCWQDEQQRRRLCDLDRAQIILCGIEAHVCVQQTALDLLSAGYEVVVCADAAGSRSPRSCAVALDRLRHEGAVVSTVESVLFELCGRCGTPRFKAMLALIKN